MTEIVNVEIVYDLDVWPRNPSNNFRPKNCLFWGNNIVKNNDKEKRIYSSYEIRFDSASSLNFGNDFAWNVLTFGVNNSCSSHTDNCINKFLVLGEGPGWGINGIFEKRFCINFSKANSKFSLNLHYSGDNSYLFVNEKEIFKFKTSNKNVNFPTQFCLGSISNRFNWA